MSANLLFEYKHALDQQERIQNKFFESLVTAQVQLASSLEGPADD